MSKKKDPVVRFYLENNDGKVLAFVHVIASKDENEVENYIFEVSDPKGMIPKNIIESCKKVNEVMNAHVDLINKFHSSLRR